MAKDNSDFLGLVISDVELIYPRLDQTYRFDHMKKETVPCGPNADKAGWSVSMVLDSEKSVEIRSLLQKHYKLSQGRNKQLPEYSGVFGLKNGNAHPEGKYDYTGKTILTARKNAKNTEGDLTNPPAVIDVYHDPLQDRAIWSGSRGSVKVSALAAVNPTDGSGGITLLLQSVLVSEPKYGGANFVDDFGPPKQRTDFAPPKEQQGEPIAPYDDLNDEIPF